MTPALEIVDLVKTFPLRGAFGGTKGSSHGAREQGRHAEEFYTTVKTAYSFAG